MRKLLIGLVATVFSAASVAQASTLPLFSVNPNEPTPEATYTGSITYDVGSQLLTIMLTNTSPAANGGFITGFVFNIDGDATATLSPNPTGTFQGLQNENAEPYGQFDFGAAIGGNWTGGGNPTTGIGVGDTGTFHFDITGPDAGSLDIWDFVTKLSPGQGGNEKREFFVVRFRGFEDDGSNKVPAVIPLPAAVWMGLSTLGGLGLVHLRKRRQARAA